MGWATEVRLPIGLRDFYCATALELTQRFSCPSCGYGGGASYLEGGGVSRLGCEFKQFSIYCRGLYCVELRQFSYVRLHGVVTKVKHGTASPFEFLLLS